VERTRRGPEEAGEPQRLNGTLTPVSGGSRLDLRDMLVTEIQSTADPGIVQVSLVAETFRQWRAKD
jgi:hypothetical protein